MCMGCCRCPYRCMARTIEAGGRCSGARANRLPTMNWVCGTVCKDACCGIQGRGCKGRSHLT